MTQGGEPVTRGAIVLLIIAILLAACHAADHEVEPVEMDPVELESFTDEFFSTQMQTLRIPGLSFVLVQNGEIVLARGYGYADLETDNTISAETTVMRIGSVSKLFVATAVMQLVEQGELDLHTDVNHYLTALQLEDTFPEPVTLAHLLTHTAGFEDPPYATHTDPQQVQPLDEHLAGNMPPRTHPPGKDFVYSNYGYALAALVVEEVSGTPFDLYVAQNIFEPLGMTQSHYLLAPPLPENMATGYFYQDGVQIPQPMDYDDDYPAGSIVTSAEDMSHFILAHLQDGCYQGACILQAATVADMHQRQAETPYKGQHVTFGFTEGLQEGQRLLGHSGAIGGFGSSLNLMPAHDLGYFFSFNEECYQTSACEIVSAFRTQFLEHFFSD
jgi:CubicO group peptidase (beta-lactamase class C family)